MAQTTFILPKRNAGSYLKSCRKEEVKTNLFKVEFDNTHPITIYSLMVEPPIPHDSGKINAIVETVHGNIESSIGSFLICGRNVFACHKNPKTQVILDANLGTQKFTITMKSVRTVDLQKLNSNKSSDTFLPLNFLNNLVKKFFHAMNFVSIGKSGKYFNPKSKNVLSNSGIFLFNGYETRFNVTEGGLFLQVDSMVRIVQTKTVLEEIDMVYSKNSHLSKIEKRQAVKSQLIGKTVMANYGNSKIWIVKDVVFDINLETAKISDDNNLTFVQYYEKSYGLTIRNRKQPVLKAVLNGTSKKHVKQEQILIPQLFLVSGLPDDFDERKRRDISQYTIIQPEEKLKRIESLMNTLNQSQNFCPNSVSENLGVKFCPVTQKCQAVILPQPVIQLGKNDCVEKAKVASFQLFNKEIFNHDTPINMVVFLPTDYDFAPIEKLFSSTCKNLCLKHSINLVRLNFHDSKKCLQDIQRYIQDKEGKFNEFDLNWFLLTPNLKAQYKAIKKMSLRSNNPKVTQVTLVSTLSKKGFASILTKILIQIASKVGNTPWAPKLPSGVNPKTMLIGIDFCKDTVNKKYNVVGYTATINKQMSKFHSNYHYQPLNVNFSTKIRETITDCLAAYGKFNNFMPDQIIILKADISDGEKDSIVSSQVNQLKTMFKEMEGYSPKLTFMTANKHSKQKFFSTNRNISNPGFGTLVNNKVVSKFYDFYLISQHCNRGTVKPIHYKVLYTDSKMQEGILQELIYVQSFNYMNWSGSVRVPSVLQYATKLATFISENVSKVSETQHLNNLLYYI